MMFLNLHSFYTVEEYFSTVIIKKVSGGTVNSSLIILNCIVNNCIVNN